MLCVRCGVTNAEAAPFCGNCGASLKKQPDTPMGMNMPGQPFVVNAGDTSARPIDELPTAHVPSVSVPSSFVPAAQIPFSQEFPLELEQAFATLTQTGGDGVVSTSSSQFAFTPRPDASVDPERDSDPQLAAPDIADYPTSTSVPIPPMEMPPEVYPTEMGFAQQDASSPGSSSSSSPLMRPGMFSLPSKTRSPASQPGLNPPSQPGNIFSPMPPAQLGLNMPLQEITQAPLQANMSSPPSQPNLGPSLTQPDPPSAPGISGPPSGGMRPPSQPGMSSLNILSSPAMSSPPSQPNMGQPQAQPNPPSHAGTGAPTQGALRPPSQPGMSSLNISPPQSPMGAQLARSNPPSQPGIYVAPPQAGMNMPSTQAGVGGAQPPQNWRGDGRYQTPPVSAQRGNVYTSQLERSAASEMARQGSVTPPGSQPAAEEVHRFVRPLPRRVTLGGPIGATLLLIGLTFLNPDWATGALIASMVAIILALLLAIATGVRVALGMLKETNPRRRAQMISTALLVLLLLLFSGGGISQQKNLHLVQGRYLEGRQNWSVAIAQYQAGGERSTASVDVARVYDEWGEAQNRQEQYEGAVKSFSMVITNYQQATKEFNRAKTGIVAAYLGWADQASQQQDYADATAHYNALLALVFCDTSSSCTQLAQPRDATAYYHLAEQQLARQQYAQAVNAYQTLTIRFPRAPESGQIHAHYAQALWGQGQQQLGNTCSNALSTYRLLAKLFADTSEGQQAATALTKPVQVQGHFTQSIPGSPYHPTAFLVQGLVVGIQQYQFPPLLAHAPTATIRSDGSFTFSSVPQGTYELVWSSDNTLHFYYAFSGKHVLYVAHLGPLCTYNYGDITQAIPTK